MKEKIDKGDLYLLKEHSSLSDSQLGELLEQKSYANITDWQKFIKYLTLALGAGFLLSGIVFFFAYNWADLHKNIKFLLVFTLLTISVIGAVYPKLNAVVKQVSLLSASILVGVLFAVYGQVYQTGANAYDLFFMWVLAVTPWSVLNKFSPQWLFYAVLANTTLILYFLQVTSDDLLFYSGLFLLLLNVVLYLVPIYLAKKTNYKLDRYYTGLLSLACFSVATSGIITFIFVSTDRYIKADLRGLYMLVIASIAWFIGSFLWSRKAKDLLLYSYFLLSVFAIVFALIIKIADINEASLLLYALYCIGGTFGIVKLIINQKKVWSNEQ
ncbi:DUF2157 domain-containing protein [Myroides odoratimimus]|uniref:DUF2157 domain-containing protein n=1 Tax=Myroides odoratimimus TaxID=76832 RepID=UPI000352CC56|nr:DUF2157 domain-containing protein [Myroides odoratimimus]EPH12302.1 hypothetical protein HMPREF9713_01143 [Myroides odoratimimus CCUG 12700]QBK77265.1 DUF2157 domain-containing protein [Myroides odoratimimus]